MKRDVCILGLGLIGGSLMKDLKAAGHPVFGFNRSPSGVKAAVGDGFSATDSLGEVLVEAEKRKALIVIATPMPAVAGLLDQIAQLAPSCGITDVVSVKKEVYRQVKQRGLEHRYVGGHPMAGTADSGWTAAQEGLFTNAAWVVGFDYAVECAGAPKGPLEKMSATTARIIDKADNPANINPGADNDTPPGATPTDPVPAEWIDLFTDVVAMAHIVGAQVIPATYDLHDSAVARISHLPHLLAESLAIVGDNGGALALSLAAGSFSDGTRVAGSHPSLVRAMCETNHEALLVALDEALSLLTDARANLAANKPSVEELTDAGYRSRIRWEARSQQGDSQRPILRLHPGAPGWVAQLRQAENLGARIEVF
ncbi:prephenate dehydrogenase [Corynebacterium sp. CCM 8862]|uniref:Prephenate dehydrogenase n=2 Tax=Corynebacterium mendelii TaxID=2765362 RepID=A0A939IWR9_9CORY|nr:prephenate dehydrogenase [Corynebacterium mendelii]MBN9643715.1 prephenate dehydrogenase [Corynebacterium mendelii]